VLTTNSGAATAVTPAPTPVSTLPICAAPDHPLKPGPTNTISHPTIAGAPAHLSEDRRPIASTSHLPNIAPNMAPTNSRVSKCASCTSETVPTGHLKGRVWNSSPPPPPPTVTTPLHRSVPAAA